MLNHHSIQPALRPFRHRGQHGVVLVVALIMLVVISLLAAFSIRNATSSETVAGNVRTTQLATQAAEIALRYCEDGLLQSFAVTPTFTITPSFILGAMNPPRALRKVSNTMEYWDTSSSVTNNAVLVIPTSALGGATSAYKRPPECIIEAMQVLNSANVLTTTSTYLITARGFGPEVSNADPAVRARPTGSEVWLQSTLEF
ncbi:MAG: hypothetical protein CFE43_10145 [Burkholderiales bacterium PBB3]|nr:MAG: hypothetical protein CFE43_10145 [Burkholderiales bacterium PBB3]